MTEEDEEVDFVVSQDKEKAKLPPEVVQAFGDVGLPSEFTATLYKYQNGNKSPAIEGSWEDYCPTLDEIGNQFGSGNYRLHIEFVNPQGDKDKKSIRFSLGSGYDEGYIRNQQLKRQISYPGQKQDMDIDRMLDVQLKLKSLTGGQNNDIAGIMTGFMGIMGTMFQQMNTQNQQMIALVLGQKNQKPERTIKDTLEEMKLLQEIAGETEKAETMGEKLVDAGIEVFKQLAPQIVNGLNNPLLRGVTRTKLENNPAFQEMKSNPTSKAKLLEYLSERFPAKKVETAIAAAGLNES